MTKERFFFYDTTQRDGQQTQGVQFSTEIKVQIAQALDALGVDYIEGGWPGATSTDSAFFEAAPRPRARFTAFGMTKRVGRWPGLWPVRQEPGAVRKTEGRPRPEGGGENSPPPWGAGRGRTGSQTIRGDNVGRLQK